MNVFLVRLRRVVLGLSAGMLATALIVEIPGHLLASDDQYLGRPCPHPDPARPCDKPICPELVVCGTDGPFSFCRCRLTLEDCPCELPP